MWGAHGALIGVVAALLAAGIGIPIPEDLSLLTAGYLAWKGDEPLVVLIPACLAAIVIGDCSLYWLGRTFGPRITQHRFLRHRLTPKRLLRVEGYFLRHGAKTILVSRFAAGARAFFYITAGAMRMSFARFVLFDALGAGVSATAWILIGRRFGAQIDRVRAVVHQVEHVAILAVVAALAAWLVTRLLRRRIAGPPTEA
jgi:membrane protein DedA with SNARE-associated domain